MQGLAGRLFGVGCSRTALARAALGLGLALAIGATGCSKKNAEADLAADESGGISGSEFDTGTTGYGDDGYGAGEKVKELATIFFDFDSADIRSDARSTLQSNARNAEGRSEWKTIIVEGHTDERGSEEYNLALGERRANATRDYLVDLGVDASRMRVVSFGETSPAVQGHDESAFRWNRRAEFRVTR